MTKLITILIGCSLALAVSVKAEQEDPKAKAKTKPVAKQQVAPKGPRTLPSTHVQTHTNTPHTNPQLHTNTQLHNDVKIHDNNVPKHQFHTVPADQTNKVQVDQNKIHVDQANKIHVDQANKLHPGPTNKLNPVQPNNAVVKKFTPKHMDFHAKINPAVTSAHFNQNFHIKNAQNWKGDHYKAFQSYHPEWHDKGWWHSHHNHVVLIGGGWYFWDAGYWRPAWGYDDSAAYYPYDGPIYVGNNPTPLDQVVADVQSALQEQGYYHGEVDGLVGPQTQEALAAYQSAQGLEQTAAIDEPTLESLGLNS
jgi:hypothetical protein